MKVKWYQDYGEQRRNSTFFCLGNSKTFLEIDAVSTRVRKDSRVNFLFRTCNEDDDFDTTVASFCTTTEVEVKTVGGNFLPLANSVFLPILQHTEQAVPFVPSSVCVFVFFRLFRNCKQKSHIINKGECFNFDKRKDSRERSDAFGQGEGRVKLGFTWVEYSTVLVFSLRKKMEVQ